ncbi:hypothetical protein Pcinc_015948 [Petrolisthes cinctipes]|uniref:Uncharacterized protein n=1 Tax=Petrolisthes cinctipes TaxID=88211 RepID=A0AAE1KRL7_PETCI|nr:hypothetical protein Pcinc_015948 [Petrolisthes cinctipes]
MHLQAVPAHRRSSSPQHTHRQHSYMPSRHVVLQRTYYTSVSHTYAMTQTHARRHFFDFPPRSHTTCTTLCITFAMLHAIAHPLCHGTVTPSSSVPLLTPEYSLGTPSVSRSYFPFRFPTFLSTPDPPVLCPYYTHPSRSSSVYPFVLPFSPCNATPTPPSLPRPSNKSTMSRRSITQPTSTLTGPLPPLLTLLHSRLWLNLLLVPSFFRTARLLLSYG